MLPSIANAQMGIPTVTNVQILGSLKLGDTYRSNAHLTVAVSFSEMVTVTGIPQLAITIGTQQRQAGYFTGSGSTTLSFGYTLQYSDVDTD